MSAPPLIVTSGPDPDLDGASCAIAYAELLRLRGQRADAWLPGRPDAEAAYVLGRFAWVPRVREPPVGARFVLVDASETRRLPPGVDPAQVIAVIDHRLHDGAAEGFPNAELQIEPVGAAATLVFEAFRADGAQPSRPAACLLFGGIYSNTLSLRGGVTTTRDRVAAAWLFDNARIPRDLITAQFAARRREILADLPAAIARERVDFAHPDGVYALSQLELTGAEGLARDVLRTPPLVAAMGDRAMLNLVDPVLGRSWLVVPDRAMRKEVKLRLGRPFRRGAFASNPALLRKQIVAMMRGWSW